MQPLNIGIAGLGPGGEHHFERILLRDDSRVVGAYDDDASRAERIRGLGASFCDSLDALLAISEINLIFVAAPFASRAEIAIAALNAGKHVAVEPPLSADIEATKRITALARERGRILAAIRNRNSDQFLLAREAVRAGIVGEVTGARLAVWCRGLQSLPSDELLIDRGALLLHELIELVPDRPQSVFALLRGERSGGGFLITVEFAGGALATIDLHLGSPVASQTGWILAGSKGGHRNLRNFHVADDGEVFDTPAEVVPLDAGDFYDGLLRDVREGNVRDESESLMTVAALLGAALESTKTGRLVALN